MTLFRLVVAVALLALAAHPAFAQATTVDIPYGQWLAGARDAILPLLAAAFAWFTRHLPGYAVALIKTFHVDQMFAKAVAKAINEVAGADHDAALKVDVGNEVLARAVNYVTRHAPAWLVEHAGGWQAIGEKLIARMRLEADATVKDGVIVKAAPRPR